MKTSALPLLALLIAPVLRAEPRLSSGVEEIPRNLIASGGGLSSGGGLILDASIGESVVSASAATLKMTPGLMPLIAQPGSVTSITAVSKATGTLELAWSSPGLDGFLGDVVAGFYRIDSSSDPLHVFDPTVFLTEFATNTTPGAPQSYVLTGLLPNTTYYSRIYLSDSRKAVSETSAPSAESSLARVPNAPVFSAVNPTSVSISWTLPADGAGGFLLDASSTNFLGGTVVSSRTANGVAVTLTVSGLQPATTYFFNLASLNWQSDVNFTSVLSTCTAPGTGVPPIESLAMTADNLNRLVTLTWVNPLFDNPAGVTILVSTNPISATLVGGTPYPAGTVLGDGSVVKSIAPASSYLEASLTLDVTGYFSLYSRDATNAYSLAVTTSIVLDLPPMAPAGLRGALSSSGTSYFLNWADVASNLDGAGFRQTAPNGWELCRYDVYRATGIAAANWVWIGSTTVDAPFFAADVPVPGAVFYYRVVSRDAFDGALADAAMAIDTLDGLWVLHPDGITRFQIPSPMAGVVRAAGNPHGMPLLLRAEDRPQDVGGRVIKSVRFNPVASPSNRAVTLPSDATSGSRVALRYETAGGLVVPNGLGTAAVDPAVSAAAAPDSLAAYYVNGPNAAKVFGHVDPSAQEVSLQSNLLGGYQIRSVARDTSFSMDTGGVSNRALTPNGDGLNDTVVFTFDNPKDSAFTGKLYDLRGRFVSEMRPGPVGGSSLLWDGKAGGVVVPRGVYMYQIQAEGRTFNGTVVVIR
ncbi:MAG: fibronectin type III domain-containing protein [Elusimicrobia bacterium]|nr:fibronectin type III domain-containing protein [Elusimicrobiota bacterium]